MFSNIYSSDKILRIAAYCRVSTDKDDQVNSLESQKKYFRDYIERNPFWELTEIYVDEGITGTSTKKRHAFNRMMIDAENGQFDLIITKEISRFARNTLDSIFYTRKLKDFGIGVIFMNDNINTLDADAELRLTIMSSIAQEESRKTSDRVKWGQKRRMEQGVVFGRDMLGYDVRGGKLHINDDGAEVVRLIFHKFVNEGKGTHIIARELREAGIQTSTYMKTWSNTVILRVLRNEKYCGDLVQKKTFTPSYLTHEKKYNRGEEELVVLRDHHEPIVDRELFDRAQLELARRSSSDEQKAKHSNRYCFSGKIKCGICGCSYVSRSKKRKDKSIYKAWRCYEGTRHGAPHIDKAGNQVGCSGMSINDEDTKIICQEVVKKLQIECQKIVNNLTGIIKNVIEIDNGANKTEDLQSKLVQIVDKKRRLLELYMNKDISKQDFQEMNAKYDIESAALVEKINANQQQQEFSQSKDVLLSEINSTLKQLSYGSEWNDTFYRHILDEIVISDENQVEVQLSFLPEKCRFAKLSSNGCHFDASLGTEELTLIC